jgi:hypothetical protein
MWGGGYGCYVAWWTDSAASTCAWSCEASAAGSAGRPRSWSPSTTRVQVLLGPRLSAHT